MLELTNLTELAFLKDSINIKGGRDYAIKYIKNNIKAFDDAICKRGGDPCAKKLLEKHNKYLSFLNKKQELQEKRNLITKSFKNSNDTEKLKKQAGTFNELLFGYGYIYDNRDKPYLPTDGFITTFSQQLPMYAEAPFIKNTFN